MRADIVGFAMCDAFSSPRDGIFFAFAIGVNGALWVTRRMTWRMTKSPWPLRAPPRQSLTETFEAKGPLFQGLACAGTRFSTCKGGGPVDDNTSIVTHAWMPQTTSRPIIRVVRMGEGYTQDVPLLEVHAGGLGMPSPLAVLSC